MDIREETARYYDLQAFPIDDVDFYITQLPSPEARVLELGCGTGRVLIPLSQHCGYILGIDPSKGMLQVCREKMAKAGVPPQKAHVQQGDATDLALDQNFDLVTAPFRVFQLMTEDDQVKGFFGTIRKHLTKGGVAILNTFNPNWPAKELVERNSSTLREYAEDQPFKAGRLVHFSTFRKPALWEGEKLVFYPNLVYQYWIDEDLVDESLLEISMRVWYPNQLLDLIETNGFEILDKWGGYHGEAYGKGPELVVAFRPQLK